MEAVKYQKRIEEFEAIQFTGGEENAREVMAWVKDRDMSCSIKWHHEVPSLDGEYLFIDRRQFGPGIWILLGNIREGFEFYLESEFQKIFQPTDNGLLRLPKFGNGDHDLLANYMTYAADNAALKYTDTGIEEAKASEVVRDDILELDAKTAHQARALADLTIEMIKAHSDSVAVVKQAAKRLEGWISDQKVEEIKGGVIDSVPASGIEVTAEIGQIKDVTAYTEDTLFKVMRALMDCRLGQPQAEELIQSMQNAGILFRERV